jgi:uncharacterized protein YbjT (DUF2867 family)
MTTVIMTGATGLVGSRALPSLLSRSDVDRVVALGRRMLTLRHEKLVSKVVDLQTVTVMAAEIPDAPKVAICALGTTMKQAGSKEAFSAVDRDAVVAFGEAALKNGAERFVLVSAVGANAHSGSFYVKTNGEAEAALVGLGFPQLTVLRPSLIDDQGSRADHRLGERIALPLSRALFAVIGKTHRYAPISVDTLARALVHLAFDETSEKVRFVESDRLHALGG